MRPRAVIIGVLGALLMGAGGQYAAKYIEGMWGLIRGHLPVSVFGALVVFVLVLNPLLGRIRASWRFRPKEIAFIFALILVACGIAEAGMMRYFPRSLVRPIQQNRIHPGWERVGVLDYTPKIMLANEGKYSEEVVDNYIQAMGSPGNPIAISEVPWHAWWRPLLFWTSVITLTMIGVLSLSVLVHRQWADRERIRYPIAEIASSLLRTDETGRSVITRQNLFWVGLLIVLFVRIVNGIYAWFPSSIEIPLTFDFSAIGERFPEFMRTRGAARIMRPSLYPAAIGLTFLLASDIGLSLGLANAISVVVLYALLSLGMDFSGSDMRGGLIAWNSFGASLALAVMLIYVGRRYYWQTFKQAVSFRPMAETEPAGVWAFRSLLLCMAAAVLLLRLAGVDLPVAALAMGLVMLLFVTIARLNAECGTFFLFPAWSLAGVVVGLFGFSTLGPSLLIVLGLMMYMIQSEGFEAMMPFAVNGLKMTSDTGLKPGKTGFAFGLVVLLIIAVAVPTALWADYNHPAALRRGAYGTDIFNAAQTAITQLDLSGRLDEVVDYSSWERVRNMRPESGFAAAAGIGFGLMLLFSFLRLRCTWWPFHWVLLLVFATRTASMFGASFFLGWLIKVAVSKFGGAAKYNETKPLMIGLIVGDLAGGFVLLLINWIYYVATGMRGARVIIW